MKIKILLLSFLFATSTYSQCGDVIKSTYDEFEKTTLNEAEINLRAENGMEFIMTLRFIVNENTGGRTPYIRVSAHMKEGSNPANVGSNPYIHFLFEDGSSEKLYGGDHFGNYFSGFIWLKSFDPKSTGILQAYEAVKYRKLKAIRFNKDYDKFDFQLTNQQKDRIQKIFNCITK
ncbi:hypothetical protein AAIP55_002100 [Flavobacterium psychrophilum]|nr:hypothetical protein [Flavobacterium psychrophilum]EKT4517928.1 hypothetical protein [Flavobacterium psychrophilum]EKT4550815.1 hypothetical protein [Flavobacterium psychrophilum]